MPNIDTLVDDIYGLFGGESIDLSPDYLNLFTDDLAGLIKQRFESERTGGTLRMSNIGRPDRQLWYDVNWTGPVEELQPATLIKFMYGDIIEHMMLLFARMAGHEVTFEQAELELNGIKGHCDAVIDGVVVDVKSASTYSFEKFRTGTLLEDGNDPFGYLGQLSAYVAAINPEADGAFLAVDKTLGKVCLLKVPNEVLKQYEVEKRVEHVKEMAAQPEPPERCYEPVPYGKSGNYVLATGCSYCNHKSHCWADANGGAGLREFYYSSGPKYFTHVEKEPRVVEGDF